MLIIGFGRNAYSGQQRILVIIEVNAYSDAQVKLNVDRYINDINTIETDENGQSKLAELITVNAYTNPPLSPLSIYQLLQTEYMRTYTKTDPLAGDPLEGAVLIGDLPVPLEAPALGASGGNLPFDQVYMDIVYQS